MSAWNIAGAVTSAAASGVIWTGVIYCFRNNDAGNAVGFGLTFGLVSIWAASFFLARVCGADI